MLSGGGARGAYEAGVLRYLLTDLADRLGHPPRLDFFLGTSVGAIHACYLAGQGDRGAEASEGLRQAWLEMRLEELFRLTPREALRLPARLFGWRRGANGGGERKDRLHGVLDTTALERLVERVVPWDGIRRHTASGRVRAICVAATEVQTGCTMLFGDGIDFDRLDKNPDPTLISQRVDLTPAHVMASAAIPVLFPAVRAGGAWYVDGGLRLNSPLSPAIHLGADRILVVALNVAAVPSTSPPVAPPLDGDGYRSPLALYGSVLKALLLDRLNTDLGRMHFVNSVLQHGERALGPEFLPSLNRSLASEGGPHLRPVEDLVIRASTSFGALASEIVKARRERGELSAAARAMTAGLGFAATGVDDDLLSYLFFDPEFTEALMELGRRDAAALEDPLVDFFTDP